jgi:hypothetical protein
MPDIRVPSEDHFRFHRRFWQVYLLFCAAMAIGTVVAVLLPGDNPAIVLVPAGGVLITLNLMIAHRLVARRRDVKEYDAELRRIGQDEWLALSRRKALRDALLAVIFAQGPLMFFMAYVPPAPSVVGMGMLTTAIGCGVYAGSYLHRSRASVDE